MREDSFLRGALILTLAGLVSRALGAVYRVFLYPLLGPEGMGLFQMAYPVYSTLLALSTSGANVALSRLVSDRCGRGQGGQVPGLFQTVALALGALGAFLSVGLFWSAPWLAGRLYRDPRAALPLQAVAPAVFLVVLLSAYRGLFQGYQRMGPPAVSQVLEQLVRLGTIFVLAWLLLPYGLPWAAAGAAFGAVTGGAAALLYLAVRARFLPPLRQPSLARGRGGKQGSFSPLGEFLAQAIPISLTGGMFTLFLLADVVVPGRLQRAGLSPELATAWYGRLTGGAMPLVNLPSLFTASLQLALVPAVARCLAAGDEEELRRRAATALRFTVAISGAAALGLVALAEPICLTLYGDPLVAVPLRSLALSAVFLGLQQTVAGILQGMGLVALPAAHLGVAAAVKVLLTWHLAGCSWGVVGAAWASVAGFGLAALLGLVSLGRRVGPVVSLVDLVARPGAALAVMGLCLPALYQWGRQLAPQGAATLLAVGAGATIYLVAWAAVGGFKSEDLEMLPAKARFLKRWLEAIGWFPRR